MQPDLPWNVAGIAPEAREAARAAARREGLSVGEWLTRRILRSLQELGISGADNPWHQQPAPSYRAQPIQTAASNDAEDMPVSRSDGDIQSVYKRIEDQLRNVSRRLETTERSQNDNGRAMNKAATEINIATREQAQAFDQLGTHVVTLADRVGRVEQLAANDTLKDAVRGLHSGLARLAEQISQTANQSANQIEALAGNVESVVGKLGAAEQTSRSLEERISAIAERVAGVERAAQSSATTIERTLDSIERAQSASTTAGLEIQRQAASLAQVNEALERLSARVNQGETNTAASLAKLDEGINTAANNHSKAAVAISRLESGMAHIADNNTQTANAISRLENGVASATESNAQAANAIARLESGFSQASDNHAQTANAVARLENTLTQAADYNAQTANAVTRLEAGLMQTADNHTQTANAVSRLESGLAQMADSHNQTASAIARLENSAALAADNHAQTTNAITRLEDGISRATNSNSQTAGAISRLENTIAQAADNHVRTASAITRLEDGIAVATAKAQDSGMDRRLLGIEHGLADIAGRLDTAERSASGNNFEESVRSLGQRVDAADKRHRDALAELRAAVKDANCRLEGFEAQTQQAPVAQAFVAPPPMVAAPQQSASSRTTLDMPPFPDIVPPASSQSAFQQTATTPLQAQEPSAPTAPIEPHMDDLHANDPQPSEPSQPFGANHSFGADAFAATAAQEAEAATSESFLTAARRSAREASTSTAESTNAPGMFAWATQRSAVSSDSGEKPNIGRYVLIGGLVLLVLIAVVAGKMLSGMFGGHHAMVVPQNISKLVRTPRPAKMTAKTSATINGLATAPNLHAPLSDTKTSVDVAEQTDDQSAQKQMGATYPIISAQAPAQTPPQPVADAKVKPVERLTNLAKAGNVMAEAVLGFDYLDGGNGVSVNEAESARWLERAANQGNAVAAYRLGTLYERGHGVPTDTAKAMQWYTIAAKQGNRKAMHNLAVAFAEGNGVPKNMAFAVQWFTRAANLGLSDSQFNLAVLYERGMGVPQSLTEAYKWYAIAAAQGDAESKTRVDALATQLTPADKQTAQHAADTFKPKPLEKATNNPPTSGDILGN